MQWLELHNIKGRPKCARDLLLDGISHQRVSLQTSERAR